MKQAIRKHLPHLEDLLIEDGVKGFQNFKKHVTTILDRVTRSSFFAPVQEINLKIDGSMMLLFGTDPRSNRAGEFFIATKSGLSQKEPKLLHTYREIDENYSEPALNKKLKTLLPILKMAYPDNQMVYQCDVLFTKKSDKKIKTIHGEKYVTFTPNLITYAVSYNNYTDSLCDRIRKAEVGIVIHEMLRCTAVPETDSIQLHSFSRKPGVHSLRCLNERKFEIFCISSNIPELVLHEKYSGSLKPIPQFLQFVEKKVPKISAKFWKVFLKGQLQDYFKMFLNKETEKASHGFHGDLFLDVNSCKANFKQFVFDRFEAEKLTKKTPLGVKSTQRRCQKLLQQIDMFSTAFTHLIEATHVMSRIKRLLLYAFSDLYIPQFFGQTFIQGDDGTYDKVYGEGFVLFMGDSHVKLVDRCAFSRLNRISNKRFRQNEKEVKTKQAQTSSP